jgi:hypothetical protein
MSVPKLNNHIEKRADEEIEQIRNPWQQLKEHDEDLQKNPKKKEFCCNKNIVKSNN